MRISDELWQHLRELILSQPESIPNLLRAMASVCDEKRYEYIHHPETWVWSERQLSLEACADMIDEIESVEGKA